MHSTLLVNPTMGGRERERGRMREAKGWSTAIDCRALPGVKTNSLRRQKRLERCLASYRAAERRKSDVSRSGTSRYVHLYVYRYILGRGGGIQ